MAAVSRTSGTRRDERARQREAHPSQMRLPSTRTSPRVGRRKTNPLCGKREFYPIAIFRGWACFALGRVRVNTPSSRFAPILSWSISPPSAKERAYGRHYIRRKRAPCPCIRKSMRPSTRRTSLSTWMVRSFFSTPGISIVTVSTSSVSKMSARNVVTPWDRLLLLGDQLFFLADRHVLGVARRRAFRFGSLLISPSPDRYGLGLRALGLRQEEREDAVAIFRLDAVRIDLDRQGQRPIEPAGEPLPAVHGGLLGKVDRLRAG